MREQVSRREFLVSTQAGFALAQTGEAKPNLIEAPAQPADWARWRKSLEAWREQSRASMGYSDALYRRPEFEWVQSSFACCFLMLCDESFYDAKSGYYRTDEFLESGLREFGGFDSLVLWHAYPRIGLDDRNQFDFYRGMPGGLAGLRAIADTCHRRGVRVFIDYNPWDTGTRREPLPDADVLAEIVKAIDADGIFLDTMNRGAREFREKLDAARRGVVLESEGALPLENLHDHHMSWAQWFKDSHAPGVLRNKWFERRHMQHQIHRFSRSHTAELHTAWMNGTGMMVWENVFGTWVGWSERDKSTLRAMLPLQRQYARVFSGEGWTPLVEGCVSRDAFASLWEGEGLRLWTLVNRGERELEGEVLEVAHREGDTYFDLMDGRKVKPRIAGGRATLTGKLPARGIGGFLAGPGERLGEGLKRNPRNADSTFPERETQLRAAVPTRRLAQAPAGMVRIAGGRLRMKTQFRMREAGFYESTHPHFAAEGAPSLHKPFAFEQDLALTPYAIDLTPVTNREYAQFMRSSGYRPKQMENFLRHWVNGMPSAGMEEHPVVWVDLDDARAYATWAGKRLPSEAEWQFAAQGTDGRTWPWGNEMRPDCCNSGQTRGTTAVTAFPNGRSPFGVYDMCGNTWEWTENERSDGRTRFAIIRGGSWYEAKGSVWYMDGGPRPADFGAKFLLMWPGLDRCATVGFRCVVDLA